MGERTSTKKSFLLSMYEIIRQTHLLMLCILIVTHYYQRRIKHDYKNVFRLYFSKLSGIHYRERITGYLYPQGNDQSALENWKATIDFKTCVKYLNRHGTIYQMDAYVPEPPPLHDYCRCVVEPMDAIEHGGATRDGVNGADYCLFTQGTLPDYYITRADAIALGWKSSKPLSKYAPGKMLFGGIYFNEKEQLPSAPGRVWFEADINYYSGRRNSHRILFSNDGLIFVSYDHCHTFYEIV